jgi:hypothetical protein
VSSPKQVARKTSTLPSGFSPIRSALEEKAMRVPLSLIVVELKEMALPVVLVTWVKVVVVVSKRKASELPSGFSPVRSALDVKAMRVPLPLIAGDSEALPVVLVTWVRVVVVVLKRKTSRLPSRFPPVRFPLEEKAMRVPLPLIAGLLEEKALPWCW